MCVRKCKKIVKNAKKSAEYLQMSFFFSNFVAVFENCALKN